MDGQVKDHARQVGACLRNLLIALAKFGSPHPMERPFCGVQCNLALEVHHSRIDHFLEQQCNLRLDGISKWASSPIN